jgi:hypothetical protein
MEEAMNQAEGHGERRSRKRALFSAALANQTPINKIIPSVPTLRISQSGPNVEAAFEGDGLPRQTETRPFSFQLSPQDAEDIRWYLEDYLVYPVDPLPKTAHRMRQIGEELFRGILHGSKVWSSAESRLEETRVEVESDIANAVVPWKLLRPPDLDQPLALHVPAFVRWHPQATL